MKRIAFVATAIALAVLTGPADASNWMRVAELAVAVVGDRPSSVNHQGSIEYGFSPGEGAEKLVLKVIGAARTEIRMMTYSLTSVPVVEALIAARHRGVDVGIVSDFKSNVTGDSSGKARAALSALVNAGCRVRVIKAFAIHHDKVLVVDKETVETGSFNFSGSAATRNSENVMVVWRNQDLARGYLAHWQDRFNQGADYMTNY